MKRRYRCHRLRLAGSADGLFHQRMGGVQEAVSTAIFAPTGAVAHTAAALGMEIGGGALITGLAGGVLYGIEGLLGLRARR